jgi:phosphocarrier protein HPr
VVDPAGNTVQREVIIPNSQGLHLRPIAKFTELGNRFSCSVAVCSGAIQVDGKSAMEMPLLKAEKGARLRLIAAGEDAEQAVEALANLVERGFDEE